MFVHSDFEGLKIISAGKMEAGREFQFCCLSLKNYGWIFFNTLCIITDSSKFNAVALFSLAIILSKSKIRRRSHFLIHQRFANG